MKKKKKKKKTKTTNKRQNNARTEKKPHEGPYGYMHPEEIDVSVHFVLNLLNIRLLKASSQLFFAHLQWTEAQYRCPDCEDTLIIYDPWWGPPPELHIPV